MSGCPCIGCCPRDPDPDKRQKPKQNENENETPLMKISLVSEKWFLGNLAHRQLKWKKNRKKSTVQHWICCTDIYFLNAPTHFRSDVICEQQKQRNHLSEDYFTCLTIIQGKCEIVILSYRTSMLLQPPVKHWAELKQANSNEKWLKW